jgi:hypothetical protein
VASPPGPRPTFGPDPGRECHIRGVPGAPPGHYLRAQREAGKGWVPWPEARGSRSGGTWK